jgi:hypothetical protein
LYVFLIELPALILRHPKTPAQTRALHNFQLALAVGLVACSLGSLGLWGLYHQGIPYDKFVHFGFPFVMVVTGIEIARTWWGWSFKKSSLVLVLILLLSGVAWEYIEFFFAFRFHLGFYGTLFDHDSIFDMVANAFGTLAGFLWAARRFISHS